MANSVPSYVSHNLKIVPPHPPTINGKPTEPKQAIKMYNNEHFFATLNLNLDSKLCSEEPDWGLTISYNANISIFQIFQILVNLLELPYIF